MTHVDTPRGFAPAAAATRAGRVAWWSIALAVLLVALGVLVRPRGARRRRAGGR